MTAARFEIRGFGTFDIRGRKGYTGRNPNTGEPVEVKPKKSPLSNCGIEGEPIFRFYTYYAVDDQADKTVDTYMAARKLYQADELDMEVFPW